VMLTLLGISATTTSNIEMQIADNERNYQRAFYVADAGIEHARSILTSKLVNNNAANLATGSPLEWDFALDGSEGIGAATGTDYGSGAILLNNISFAPLSGYTYTVTVWNNSEDGGGATNDTDSVIMVQSDVSGPSNVQVSIRVSLIGSATGEAITGYSAQAGAGAGKNYSSDDLNPIDFSTATIQF
jgi:Tfp pilus assembly protein PilX